MKLFDKPANFEIKMGWTSTKYKAFLANLIHQSETEIYIDHPQISGLLTEKNNDHQHIKLYALIDDKKLSAIGSSAFAEQKLLKVKSSNCGTFSLYSLELSDTSKALIKLIFEIEKISISVNYQKIKLDTLVHIGEISTNEKTHHSNLPLYFEALLNGTDKQFIAWLIIIDQKKRLLAPTAIQTNSIRLIHRETDGLCLDQFGSVVWFSSYKDSGLGPRAKKFFEEFGGQLGWEHFLYRYMINRGSDPDKKLRIESSELPSDWSVLENTYKLLLKNRQGQSAGIFLDQRANRRWVLNNSKAKSVLNLFSYTCGFSLAAALGGAAEVVSVDSSKASLEWGKENFVENNLDPGKFQFYGMEADRFLSSALKNKRTFDLVICDPPSFARNKKSVFKIENELQGLLEKADNLLNPKGEILFSLNYEAWSQIDFDNKIREVCNKKDYIEFYVPPDGDFETPDQSSVLKWIFLKKIT